MKPHTVGASSRTPIKHTILNSSLGRIAGVLSIGNPRVPAKPPLLVFDLCAGDGVGTTQSGVSSPQIIKKHINFHGLSGSGSAVFVEKSGKTFDVLCNNFGLEKNIELINDDALNVDIFSRILRADQAVYLHVDPNSIAQWPIAEKVAKNLPATATFLITLGCNVGGLKRLVLDDRQEWFYRIDALTCSLPKWHDLILISLNTDSSQWAYLLRVPILWSNDELQKINGARMQSMWPAGLSAASIRKDPAEFKKILKQLFLTNKERTNGIS